MIYLLGLLKKHKVITILITIVAAMVAPSQPLCFYLKNLFNNINFYIVPLKKLKAFSIIQLWILK